MGTQRKFSELTIGETAEFSKTVSESDVYMFAGIVGDFNPVHVNQEYAKETLFGGRIAHGMLTASFISTVLGMQLPGPGSIYRKQEVEFLAPVKIGDTVTARVEVIEMQERKRIVVFNTTVVNQENVTVVRGRAEIKMLQ